MSKRVKTLIIVFAALAILGGGYYGAIIYQRNKPAPEPYRTQFDPSPRLGNLDNTKLVKIEIPGMVFEKTGAIWEITSLDGEIPPDRIELDQSQFGQFGTVTYNLAGMWAERVIDEDPEDLSVYGLDIPSAWAIVTDLDGNRVVYLRGDMTPSRTAYYVMEEGDPAVYVVSTYTAENMSLTLDKIRDKALLPMLDLNTVTQLLLDSPETRIALHARTEAETSYLVSPYVSFIMTSPYRFPRGVSNDGLQTFFESFNGVQLGEVVDDNPSTLTPYGLDRPARLFVETNGGTLDMLIGNPVSGYHYAKLSDDPRVFTIAGMNPILNIRPINLVDKFALIFNIDTVEYIMITGGEINIRADLEGVEDDVVYSLNGRKTEIRAFRTWYQTVIGLLIDAEYPGPARNLPPEAAGTGEITVEYRLRDHPGSNRLYFTLVPYDRDFYALLQEGETEFLISRNQVRQMYQGLNTMSYID